LYRRIVAFSLITPPIVELNDFSIPKPTTLPKVSEIELLSGYNTLRAPSSFDSSVTTVVLINFNPITKKKKRHGHLFFQMKKTNYIYIQCKERRKLETRLNWSHKDTRSYLDICMHQEAYRVEN
jgi:hypothetical protein